MAKQIQAGQIPIGNWNAAGLSFSKYAGLADSFYKLIGLDMHSEVGVLKVEQKLTKDSGSTVTEFCKARVNCSNGIRYWFSSTSGKVWQDKNGTYTLVYTVSAAAGESKILGAAEYQGYIYFATQSRLHRISISLADGSSAWTTNAVPNWATFGVTDIAFHPMFNHTKQQILYIGDGNQLAQVDAGVFSANALDIEAPLRIKTVGQIATDVLVGTYVSNNVNSTEIIRWDGASVSFQNSDSIPEVGINAFLIADNMVLVQAGLAGNIYSYDGTNLTLYNKIPGVYSSTAYGEVYHDSVSNKEGQMLFGFSNGSGNPAEQLVYRIAKYNSNFNYILDQPYPISERSGSDFVMSGLEIGGIMVSGQIIYVAWKNGSSYGIDKLDATAKLNGAYFETRRMVVNRSDKSNMGKIYMNYVSLPESTDLDFYINKNYSSYGSALTTIVDDLNLKVETYNEADTFSTLQLKVKFTTSSNNAPIIESGGLDIV